MTAPKDIFLPSLDRELGSIHPINQVKDQLTDLLKSFGFEVAEGPEVETEEYNFDMLNIPHLIQQGRCMIHSMLIIRKNS